MPRAMMRFNGAMKDNHRPLRRLSLTRCECRANDHSAGWREKRWACAVPLATEPDRQIRPRFSKFRCLGWTVSCNAFGRRSCTRLIDAEPLLRGSEEKALKCLTLYWVLKFSRTHSTLASGLEPTEWIERHAESSMAQRATRNSRNLHCIGPPTGRRRA